MRSTAFAERILALFTDRERASCIVGDLAETARSRGSLWFWRSLAGTALRLGWRSGALFLACMAGQIAVVAAVSAIMNALSATRHGAALPPLGPVLGFSAMLLASIAVYAGFRYGLRLLVTRLAAGITLVAFAGSCLQASPAVARCALALVLGLILSAALTRPGRRALAATVIAFTASAVVFFVIVMVNNSAWGRSNLLLRFPVNFILVIGTQWAVLPRLRGVNLISESN